MIQLKVESTDEKATAKEITARREKEREREMMTIETRPNWPNESKLKRGKSWHIATR